MFSTTLSHNRQSQSPNVATASAFRRLVGIMIPIVEIPPFFIKGRKEYESSYGLSHDPDRAAKGEVLMRVTDSIDITNPFKRYLLTVSHALQLHRPLPLAVAGASRRSLGKHKPNHEVAKWVFMFVFVGLYFCNFHVNNEDENFKKALKKGPIGNDPFR